MVRDQEGAEERRKKAKLTGYRKMAKMAGYLGADDKDAAAVAGLDGTACLISIADAKRLMKFVPVTPGASSFDSDEYKERHKLFKNGVPDSTARETQTRCDAVFRAVMNQATLRIAEQGKKTISASTMLSVLRGYHSNMLFTSVLPPIGLVRHAQKEGILDTLEEDKASTSTEKKEVKENKKIADEWEKSEQERLAARRELLATRKAERNERNAVAV